MIVHSFVQTLQDKEMIVWDMHSIGTRQEKSVSESENRRCK